MLFVGHLVIALANDISFSIEPSETASAGLNVFTKLNLKMLSAKLHSFQLSLGVLKAGISIMLYEQHMLSFITS